MQTVPEYIASLPPDERIIAQRLRSLILDTDPRIQEHLKYGVPFFFHNRTICFLWPATSPYKTASKPHRPPAKIEFGFYYGNLLSNVQGLLLAEGRKQVYVIRFLTASEINEAPLREIIREAVLVDEEFKKNRKKR